ncbi:TIGR03032 family protein [Vicingus serpentipes]|uniref:TIGR03032 family protein n=1 Tax=Vicingus serpentipes TaxID=1926625 RepID=A0A5C6RRG0_9FLAO|nr:TIGR03032 family protein [Vicingus serpentipes]TXB64544.1 TIGR03032 family protein [Vicingus serpentipes]
MSNNGYEFKKSDGFENWLFKNECSLGFTTYEIGKIFLLGLKADKSLNVSERTFVRCMGMALKNNTLWLSSIFQIWRFENTLLPNQKFKGIDKLYIPQLSYTTGNIDTHDIIVDAEDRPIFVNTQFNCLATVSDTHSFKVIWKPPFISEIVPEDRCHLNGLAEENGEAAYITMVGPSNEKDGWREHRNNGGIVMDVRTNEVICSGLSLPHSPRVHNGQVWLLEAGTGYLGFINKEKKKFVKVAFFPGFLRGLHFIGDYAVVGMSKNREKRSFKDIELENNIKANNLKPTCGLEIFNIKTNQYEEYLHIDGMINELYDVITLPKTIMPTLIGVIKDDIHKMISVEQ